MGRLTIKVVPGTSRDQIVGWLGDALKIKVTAPPEKGKANEAVVTLLAKTLGVRRDTIAIVSGHGSPAKTVDIALMDNDSIKKALEHLPAKRLHEPVVWIGTRVPYDSNA
jgi:uncharacterized protein (TIGR00251 family)